MKNIIILVLACCLYNAGRTQSQPTATRQEPSFEEMVKSMERPDRSFWQKPEEVIGLMYVKGKKVMDLGCGTGFFSFRLVDSGATVIAADIDDRMLKYVDSVRTARGVSAKSLQTRKVAPNDPMLGKREADIVLIVNTFHHLEDRVNYFRKVKQGMRSQGFVVVIDFLKKDLPIGPPTDMKQSADDVIRDLKMAGFSMFKTDDKTLSYQYIVFAM